MNNNIAGKSVSVTLNPSFFAAPNTCAILVGEMVQCSIKKRWGLVVAKVESDGRMILRPKYIPSPKSKILLRSKFSKVPIKFI